MIYLIITTCINNRYGLQDEAQRKQTYLENISRTLLSVPSSIKPIIVENNGKRETYLDSLGPEVLYTNNNAETYFHKGVNEIKDVQSVIEHYQIKDDDIVIKLTGRYRVNDDTFFQHVIQHQHEFDSFVKFYNVCTFQFMEYDCVLGMFAMKAKHVKNFNFVNCNVSPEVEFATYARHIGNVCEIDSLHMTCCFAEDMRLLDV